MRAFFKINLKFIVIIKNSYFLKKHSLSPSTLSILKDLYPTINWKRVDFYEGLPWFTPLVAPYVTAQALPRFYSFGGYRIYLRKFDESRAQCIADIVHESFHILQGMHFTKGYGIGFFRGWMIYYISLFIKYGYRNNPFEIPAYDQEYRFLEFCTKNGIHGITPKVPSNAFENISREKSLVFPDIQFKYKENFLMLIGGFLFCAIVTVIKPVADTLLFVVRLIVKYGRDA